MALLLGMTACSAKSFDLNDLFANSHNKDRLGLFTLIGPSNDMIVTKPSEFSWEECQNAESYTLEICSDPAFVSDVPSVDYYSKSNITSTKFTINSELAYKDHDYYWRVTAKNSAETRKSAATFKFFAKAPEVDEVDFDLGESDDWQLHNDGSKADIVVDNSNFFHNNEKSLKISFKQEDTNRGNPSSDGWIVVTKAFDKSIYGTDALFFRCFYAGQDATVLIRLVDRDNEYWYCPVQLSYNAQQSIILQFSDFQQRLKDVTVGNYEFNYERIKYFEVVFERTFGDGVFIMSGVKAIKFSNYQDLFITKLDFTEYKESDFVYENYTFEKAIHDKYELQLNYFGNTDGGHTKINGYGFFKININRYMFAGDSVKVSIKYTGSKGSNIILRVYEEDTDRWSYSLPFNSLTEGEYQTLVIPYAAFGKSQILGDGKRQFYYVYNIQFGLEGQQGTGSLFFKDFEVVKKSAYITDEQKTRVVGSDGLIENFDNYKYAADIYRSWIVSEENKDEYINLDSTFKYGANNTYSGKFLYKADMSAALYYLPIKAEGNFTSLSLGLKDASIKPNETQFNHIDSVNADVVIYIRLATGEIYAYEIEVLDKIWHQYDIPFSAFTLTNESDLTAPKTDIETSAITHVGLSMQYFYKNAQGKPMPSYIDDSIVYVDNIYLSNQTAYHKIIKEKIISMSGKYALLDNFEDYTDNTDMLSHWYADNGLDFENLELSNNVSSQGGNKSLKLTYEVKGEKAPAYAISPYIDSSVVSKAFKISIASEKVCTAYVNFYVKVDKNTVKYRVQIDNINTAWTEYFIGLDHFTNQSGGTRAITNQDLQNITKITVSASCSSGTKENSYIYIDNFAFDDSLDSYTTNTRTVIDA